MIHLSQLCTIPKKTSKEEKAFYPPEALLHPGRLGVGLARTILRSFAKPDATIFDPMGGITTTGLAILPTQDLVTVELNKRWADIAVEAYKLYRNIQVICGNSLTFPSVSCDLVFFSPPFPNAHSAGSTQAQADILADLATSAGTEYSDHPGDMGNFVAMSEWVHFLSRLLENSTRRLAPGGKVLVHIKNHVKNNKEVRVDEWVEKAMLSLDLEVEGYYSMPLEYLSWFATRHLYHLRSIVDTDGWTVHLECGCSKTYNPKRTKKLPKSAICVKCGRIPGRVCITEERLVVARKRL